MLALYTLCPAPGLLLRPRPLPGYYGGHAPAPATTRRPLRRLPRRRTNFSLSVSRLQVRAEDVPRWASCPPARAAAAIWSMVVTEAEAVYSAVLAASVLATWDPRHPRPDLRLLVLQPTAVSAATLTRLARAGWGLCHVPRQVQGHVLLCHVARVQAAVPHHAGPEVLRLLQQAAGVEHDPGDPLPHCNYLDTIYWQYEVVVWMDSDTVAAASLHPLLEAGARLPAAGSEEPGPRIGAAYDGEGDI